MDNVSFFKSKQEQAYKIHRKRMEITQKHARKQDSLCNMRMRGITVVTKRHFMHRSMRS